MTSKKTAVLVLGPHRSGTSALARAINLLGVDLGSEMLPPKFDNRFGYWEHREVFELHELLLSKAGSAWHDYRPMAPGWQERAEVRAIRRDLVALLERELGAAPLWGVKDPRLGRLLPIWLEVLDELGVDPRFVILVRNPLEVVDSLERRNHFSHSKSILLCLADMVAAIQHTEGYRRAFVSYSGLLDDWRPAVEGIARELGIEWPREPSEVAGAIDEFLRPTERHHRRTIDDLRRDATIPEWGVSLFQALEHATRGHNDDLATAAEAASACLTSALDLFVPEIEELEAREGSLRAQLESFQDGCAAVERRAERAEAELVKVQRHLTSILSSRLYRTTRPIRHAWYGLVRSRT